MVDWMHLLINYWWVLAVVVVSVTVVLRLNNFFQFFTALLIFGGILYVATLVFFPPSNLLEKKENTQVLGVSDSNEGSESAETKENCLKDIKGREDIAGCAEELKQGIKMPDFGKILNEHIEIKYE